MRLAAPVFSNPSFWAGLAAMSVMVLALAIDVQSFAAPLPTWESAIAVASMGFALAGPISAAGAAVAVATAREWHAGAELRPARSIWQRVLQRIWPAWLAMIVGYGACLVLVAAATAPTAPGAQLAPALVAVVCAASIPAIAGALIGCVVTSVIAGPATLLGGYAISAFGLVDPALMPLGVLGGTWMPHATGSLDLTVSPALLAGPAIALVVVAGALLIAGRTRRWVRAVAMLSLAGLGAGAIGPQLTAVQAPGTMPRSSAALHCASGTIGLCLWPELEFDRARLTAQLSDIATRLGAAGLPLPAAVSPMPADNTEVRLSPRAGEAEGTLPVWFAEAYTMSLACLDPTGSLPSATGAPQSEEEFEAMYRAAGWLGFGLDGDPELAASMTAWSSGASTDPLEQLGVSDSEHALAAFADWANSREARCGVADAH